MSEEHFDVLTKTGKKTGVTKPRGEVHRDGDYHRAVHVWIYVESTRELLVQKRADNKDSWPGLWDISSAGHISAGDSSLETARRELKEELGISLPKDAFEFLFEFLEECVTNNGNFINNEYCDVYLVTIVNPIPLGAFTLQESEVSAVKYVPIDEYRDLLANHDSNFVPYDIIGDYKQLFDKIKERYEKKIEDRIFVLKNQIKRYSRVDIKAELTELSEGDRIALDYIVKAGKVIDKLYYLQVCESNPSLRDWLKDDAGSSELASLKWTHYLINKSPWSVLDENEAFLTTADSAVILLPEATKEVSGWHGLQYKRAFPVQKPPGANFYPSDMDKAEFELWKDSLSEEKKLEATGFFHVIKRLSESNHDSPDFKALNDPKGHDLYTVPYSKEYSALLSEAAELLHDAGNATTSPSLKKLLNSKADSFLSNSYYDSDINWMDLDSKLDVTIGPYETYEDTLFGYKATFESFVGVRDDKSTDEIKLIGGNLQILEQNLPMDDRYKSTDIRAAPIRVIHLIYNAGDVKGPQTAAFNLPNDERIVKDRGTAMVMLKNISQAKFKYILQPIADVCISKEQKDLVDFESFFTHIICHECCHGIGPHSITLPDGHKSTVRKELQELNSALEEAKADIVGLWALKFLITKGLLSEDLLKSMYVSFLAGCFRSIRFGLKEAHGKGQALQFNWLFEKEAFVLDSHQTFSVDFAKVESAVEELSRVILTIQANGDKGAAKCLLDKYCKMTDPLKIALQNLEKVQVPVDIFPRFSAVE